MSLHHLPWRICSFAAVLFAGFGLTAHAAEKQDAAPGKPDQATTHTQTTCPISGKPVNAKGTPITKTYEGRQVTFCCASCQAKFEKDVKGNLKKMDDATIKAQLPTYPLTTCVVSHDKLGAEGMGQPVDYLYHGRLVRFCCKGCIKDFNEDPQKFLSELDAAKQPSKNPKADSKQAG